MSKFLNEGGNVFKAAEGGSETIRIKREDVDPTLKWLEDILGIDLVDFKLGTTGKKETSGDLDIAIDKNKVTKDDLVNKLIIWLDKNHPELNLANSSAKEAKQKLRQWVAKTGSSVHFKTPIRGDEANGFVQTDLMFGNPDFMLWAIKGEPEGEYKGRDRQLLINAIATQRGLAWSPFFGLKDRETGERTNNPQEVVDKVLGPGHKPEDFDSIHTVFKIISDKEKYPDDIYNAIREKADFEFPHRDKSELESLDEAKKIEPRIQHAEDLIFFEGSEGALRALKALEKMNDPESRPETSLKWDGSPAVIFGRDADGKFIFTDKSGFGVKSYKGKVESEEEMEGMYRSRAQRAAKKMGMTPDEVFQKRYSNITPKMQKAFRLAEKSVDSDYRGYFFGEVLYFDRPEIQDDKFTFKPNMVKYKVDVDSEIGKKIADSDVGIVLHLKKDVETLENQPLDFEGMTPDPDILFFGKTFIEKPIGVDDVEVSEVINSVQQNSTAIDEFFNAEKLRKLALSNLPSLFYTYLNSKVDTGLEDLGSDFIEWMDSKPKISNQKKKNVANYISENKKTYDTIWDIVSRTMKVKDDIITNIDTEGGLPFSQSLGDEEVGEGYVLSDEGNLIKLVDRSKFTKANRAVVREQVEFDDELLDLEDSETHVFIPGGFKPPHKGHLSLLLQAVKEYPNAIIHITSGPTKRTAGDLEISAEQAKQVWEKYIEKYGINNEVELDYFDRFETNRKKKDGSTISSTSPFLRIGLRMENELDPNSKIVAVSSEDTHINFVKNAANYLNDKKGKNLTFEPLKADKIEVEPGVKFSATEMRRAISEGDFEAFKTFMPEKLSDDDVKSMFNLLGGGLEESSMGAGAVSGGGSGFAPPFTSGDKKPKQTIYREQLRYVIRHLITKERDQMLNEKKQLREIIRQIIRENDAPTKSTGLNKLIQALKIVLPTVESGYKSLTTDKEQRDSFKQHYLKALIDTLSPQDAIRNASGGEVVGMLGGSALEEQEEIEVNVKDDEDSSDLSADIEDLESDDDNQIKKDAGVTLKDIEGKKTNIPLPQIPGLDETGRDESVDVYKKTIDAITRNYRTLHNENDRKEFKEYLVTNLLLYFDKFENDISPELNPVTTPEYEKQKAEKAQFTSQGEETVSENIKKAIIKTLKNSLF
jgi:hypothetical protein